MRTFKGLFELAGPTQSFRDARVATSDRADSSGGWSRLEVLFLCVATLLASPALFAFGGAPLTQDVARELSGPTQTGSHVVIPRLTLDDGSEVSLDLERFDVFAPGAAIIEYTDKGPRRLAPPQDHYFRGSVIGDLDSVVVLVSGTKLRGFVFTKGQLYAIAPDRDVYGDDLPDPTARLRRVDPKRDRPAGMPPFHCDVESVPAPLGTGMSATAFGGPISVQPMWTSTVYTVNLAIETDYELYTKFGSSTDAELRFIGDLTAAASAIYWRDVKTVFKIGTVHLWSTAADPWTATTTSNALSELLSYWNSNYTSVQRTIVHMLSGKNMGGGIAYLGALCNSSFGYGLSSSLSTTFSVTNPNLCWDVLCYTHEIGHNFSSPHTECYNPPVDTCTPCDTFSCIGSVPAGGGTIMSYCHACSGGYSNIILYFGLNGDVSQPVLDQMRGFVESKAACLGPLTAAPTVTGVSPAGGPIGGGTALVISGTGFQPYATVTIGGVNATGVTVVNATTIAATTGAHAAGSVNVVVRNLDSQSATLANGYLYGAAPPTITSFAASTYLVRPGNAPTLSWMTSGSDSLTLNGGLVARPSGSQIVHPTTTTLYTLIASSAFGSASKALAVNVDAGTGPLAAPAVAAPLAGQTLTSGGVSFAWGAVGGATGYDLRLFAGGSGQTVFSGSLDGAGSTSVLLSLPDGAYTFAVRACSGAPSDATCGAFGSVSFSVSSPAPSGAPTVTFPTQGATLATSTQTLAWTSVAKIDPASPMRYEVVLTDITTGLAELQISVLDQTSKIGRAHV